MGNGNILRKQPFKSFREDSSLGHFHRDLPIVSNCIGKYYTERKFYRIKKQAIQELNKVILERWSKKAK